MNLTTFFTGLAQLALAAAVLLLSHYGLGWIAVIIVLAPPVAAWIRGGRTMAAAITIIPQLVLSLSVVGLISLNKPPVGQPVFPVQTQAAIALLYGAWMVALARMQHLERYAIGIAGLHQLLAVTTIFLAAAFWHWPDLLVVVATWVVSFSLAWWYLELQQERAAQLLAATWALIAGEVAWVLYSWQVNYIIRDGALIIPQAAIVILGLGYCLASVQLAHSNKRLSRRRLIEYVAIAAVLLTIVIAGTRWNGTT